MLDTAKVKYKNANSSLHTCDTANAYAFVSGAINDANTALSEINTCNSPTGNVVFLDNFTGTSLDTTNWNTHQYNANRDAQTMGNGIFFQYVDCGGSSDTNNADCAIWTKTKYSPYVVAEFYLKASEKISGGRQCFGFISETSLAFARFDTLDDKYVPDGVAFCVSTDNQFVTKRSGVWTKTAIYLDQTQYHKYRIEWSTAQAKLYVDDALLATHTTNIPSASLPIAFNVRSWSCYRNRTAQWVDWVAVRNDVTNTCTSDAGCPENKRCDNNQCVAVTCATACSSIVNHACVYFDCCVDTDCGANKVCVNHKCQAQADLTCSDGTPYGQCSSIDKSLYCDNGYLRMNISLCGCPMGWYVSGESCIQFTGGCQEGTTRCINNDHIMRCVGGSWQMDSYSCIAGCVQVSPTEAECNKICTPGQIQCVPEQGLAYYKECLVDGTWSTLKACAGLDGICQNNTCKQTTLNMGCAYDKPKCPSDYTCQNNSCVVTPGTKEKHVTVSVSPEELKVKISSTEIKTEIEKRIGHEMTSDTRQKFAEATQSISKDVQISNSIQTEATKSVLRIKVKYTGDKKIKNFYIYYKLPKTFANDAKNISINALGAEVTVLESDPTYMIFYPLVEPNQEKMVEYSVNSAVPLSVLDAVSVPVFFAESAETGTEATVSNIGSVLGSPLGLVCLSFLAILFVSGAVYVRKRTKKEVVETRLADAKSGIETLRKQQIEVKDESKSELKKLENEKEKRLRELKEIEEAKKEAKRREELKQLEEEKQHRLEELKKLEERTSETEAKFSEREKMLELERRNLEEERKKLESRLASIERGEEEAKNYAVNIKNITMEIRGSKILDNVSFDIEMGEFCGIVGPSGSGKSTIVECLSGRKTPSKGSIEVIGSDATKNRHVINQSIGFVPQHAELNMGQSVWQNMMNSTIRWGVADAETKIETTLKQLNIFNRKDLVAKNLSGGQLKLLSLGMELIRDPPVLLLDEPTTGLDPSSRTQIISILSSLNSNTKKTIIFTTHFMDELDDCNNVIIVKDGKILKKGSPSTLKKMLPGAGKIVSVTLEKVTDDVFKSLSKTEGVKKVIAEGRTLKIIMDEPNPVLIGKKIDEIGGIVEETKAEKAGMKEVFIYYTGVKPEE